MAAMCFGDSFPIAGELRGFLDSMLSTNACPQSPRPCLKARTVPAVVQRLKNNENKCAALSFLFAVLYL